MSDSTDYTIGAAVTCSDGVCGELRRVVIDPVARVLTHIVVERKHQHGQGRLVPIDLVDAAAEEIHLRCNNAEFDALEEAEETHFFPEPGEQMGYAAGQAYVWPYYVPGGPDMGGLGMSSAAMTNPLVIVDDRVPAGEVEVHRGEPVHATDGDIGRVHGLVIDPKDHRVTHVLLEEGHLWGKKEVAVPITAVTDLTVDGVRLDLTKAEVGALPPIDLARQG